MTVMRSALAILLLAPAIALGQAEEAAEDKVSNDQPGRPLQMPPASTEVKEAFDDFERFQRRGAWERALKALYTIPEAQALKFVDGEKGFIIPVARRRRAVLAALKPEGRAAYRLFYDAEAQKLFQEAEGPSELGNLERVYSAYFLSSVGDNAADRLGDVYFELGRFDRAADCWLAVLRECPDTDLAPAQVALKAALALARAGRRAEFERVRAELADRYGRDRVSLGGQSGAPAEVLARLAGDAGAAAGEPSSARTEAASPTLAGAVDPDWQVRLADSVEAGMTPPEKVQWESNLLSVAVPAVAIDGTTLYANYLGHVFAVDMGTGKLLWRSAPFHHLEVAAMQNQGYGVDPSRYAIVASSEHVWTLGRDLKDQNMMAPFRLTCRRSAGGEVVWQSSDLGDYAQIDLFGTPLLVGDRLFVVGKSQANPQQPQGQGQPQQVVLAIRPHDGKVLWKTEVGAFRMAQQYFYYGYRDTSPQPRLAYRAGALYIDTHAGVLARLDADSGALDWGFGYPTDPVQGQGRFFFGYAPAQTPASASSPPVASGEALLVKGAESGRLCAIDPNRMEVLWERPIAKSSRLLGVDDRTLYLGGPEVSALDLQTRALLWAARVPNGSAEGRLLLRSEGLWQLTPRGVFELDPKSGEVRRIYRGQDLGAAGGDLLLADRLLLTVSNRAITAYPRRAGAPAVSASAR